MRNPRFLFILTPPYSGSTALSELLNTSPRSMLLNPRGEGQWLIPSLCADNRWEPGGSVDWNLVRNTWLTVYRNVNMLVGTIGVIIEKSPPNMVRIQQLMKVFPNSSCLAFTRNPYAHCSSFLFREYTPDTLTPTEKTVILENIAKEWLRKIEHLMDAILKMNLLHFTYEQFCKNPGKYTRKVLKICPELASIDSTSTIEVKDYPPQRISNQNQRQIALLGKREVERISQVLSTRPDLLDFFGYPVI